MKKAYIIEKVHSNISFRISLLGISGIGGQFNEFSGSFIQKAKDWEDTQVAIKIPVNGIDTGVTQRDEHLQADYWFNAEKHPVITFTSTTFKKRKKNQYVVKGDLVLKDNTHNVTFILKRGGTAKDKDGVEKIGFTGKTKINREDFGIAQGAALPNGGVFLGKNVRIRVDVQLALEE